MPISGRRNRARCTTSGRTSTRTSGRRRSGRVPSDGPGARSLRSRSVTMAQRSRRRRVRRSTALSSSTRAATARSSPARSGYGTSRRTCGRAHARCSLTWSACARSRRSTVDHSRSRPGAKGRCITSSTGDGCGSSPSATSAARRTSFAALGSPTTTSVSRGTPGSAPRKLGRVSSPTTRPSRVNSPMPSRCVHGSRPTACSTPAASASVIGSG